MQRENRGCLVKSVFSGILSMSETRFEQSQNDQTDTYKMSEWSIPITALANASSLGICSRYPKQGDMILQDS